MEINNLKHILKCIDIEINHTIEQKDINNKKFTNLCYAKDLIENTIWRIEEPNKAKYIDKLTYGK